MQVRRILPAVVFGAALFVLSGCGTTNPVSSSDSALDTTPPATPQNLKGGLGESGDLVLSWDASADADVAGYDVYRYAPDPSRDNSYVKINASLVTATSYVVGDATSADAYYRVRAIDRSSNVSPSSASVEAAASAAQSGQPDLPIDTPMRRTAH